MKRKDKMLVEGEEWAWEEGGVKEKAIDIVVKYNFFCASFFLTLSAFVF